MTIMSPSEPFPRYTRGMNRLPPTLLLVALVLGASSRISGASAQEKASAAPPRQGAALAAAEAARARAEEERNRVGRLFPIPLGTAEEREALRLLYEKGLRTTSRRYVGLVRVKDPLEKYRASGNPANIPDPRRGGRSNNASDRVTNLLLGWLLYGDENARDEAVAVASWLAEILDEQDNGHVQRHPTLGLAAIAARDDAMRARLLSAFLGSLHRLENSRFFVDDPGGASWMIGMAGVRPFARAVGAAHRMVQVLERLVAEGYLGKDVACGDPFPFATPADFAARARERLEVMCSWRKTMGDDQKRGWQTEPGGWFSKGDVTLWPYLAERETRGEHVTWFHVGCIWPYEMLVIDTHSAGLPDIARLRTRELASWALEIGYDGGHSGMTGRNLRSSRGTFYPGAPGLGRPYRLRPEGERRSGEAAYALAPALFYARGSLDRRRKELRKHLRTSECTTYPGEVSWPTLLVLQVWSTTRNEEKAESESGSEAREPAGGADPSSEAREPDPTPGSLPKTDPPTDTEPPRRP